jgi:hypothetical protein
LSYLSARANSHSHVYKRFETDQIATVALGLRGSLVITPLKSGSNDSLIHQAFLTEHDERPKIAEQFGTYDDALDWLGSLCSNIGLIQTKKY